MDDTRDEAARRARRGRARRRGGALAALLAALPAAADEAGSEAGRQAFLEARCDRCHPVAARDIEARKPRASDLSTLGADREPGWIRDYLQRRVALEGEEHAVAWKGSDAELQALVDWLAKLE